MISFLTDEEAQALLDAPDPQTWTGRRDSTLLLVALRTGLRVSELTQLTCGDVHLGREANVRCLGKGRKERYTPLEPSTVAALRDWLAERGTSPDIPLFCTRQGRPLSPDAIQARLTKYHALAARNCPSLAAKKISPHTLRHSTVICTGFSARGTPESGACRIVPHEYPVLGEVRTTRPVPGSFSLRCCF